MEPKSSGQLSIAIASNAKILGMLRQRVRQRRLDSLLYDTHGWVLEVERMHRMLWELFLAGKRDSMHLVMAAREGG
jgi:hypothetical protein